MSLREDLLTGPWISVASKGVTTARGVATLLLQYDEPTIQSGLEQLAADGLLERVPFGPELAFRATLETCIFREKILARMGRRRPCLANQCDYSLDDLLVAIAEASEIRNARRRTGGFAVSENRHKTFEELQVYLHQFAFSEVKDCVDKLAARDLVQRQKISLPEYDDKGHRVVVERDAIAPSIRGSTLYKREIRVRLRLGEEESILDDVARSSIQLFYIWQKDYATSRNHIDEALKRSQARVNTSLNPLVPLAVETATEPGDGAVRIDSALIDKIRASDFILADLTPTAVVNNRLCPNPNVLIEIGYALASHKPDRIILIEQIRPHETIPGGPGSNPQFPFDIHVVHRIRYDVPARLRSALDAELDAMLRQNGFIR